MNRLYCGFVSSLLVISAATLQAQPGAGGRQRPGVAVPAGPAAVPVPAAPTERGARPQANPRIVVTPPAILKTDAASVAARKTEAQPLDISGKWTGIFTSDNVVLLAEIDLAASDPAKRKYTGELKFTAVPMAAARAAPPSEGSWKLTAAVDPATGLIALEQGGWIKQVPGMRPASFSGVYAKNQKQIAGQVTGGEGRDVPTELSMPFFLLARSENAETASAMKTLAEHAAEAQAIPRLPAVGTAGAPPSDDAIAKWADQYSAEYPNEQSAGVDRIANQALPLMDDATFKPVFGESYDKIDIGQLALAMQRVGGPVQQPVRAPVTRAPRVPAVPGAPREVTRPTQPPTLTPPVVDRPDVTFLRKYNYVQYLLKPNPPRIIAVAAMRIIDSWQTEMMSHFEKDPPVATQMDDLAAAEMVLQARAEYVWPSGKKQWDETFAKLRTGAGGATLAANLVKALETPATLEGAKSLADWPQANGVLLRSAPPAEGADARNKINEKLDAILTQLIAGKHAEVAKLPSGMQGIHASVALYQALTKDYGFVATRPPVQAVIKELMARREEALHAGIADFVKQIDAGKTVDEVDAIVTRELSVPGDAGLKDYPVIAKAAADKKMQLDHDHMMSLFTKGEKDLMDRPGHIDLKKGAGAAPTAEDVRMALLRGFAGTTGKLIDDHNALNVTRSQSFGIPYTLNVKLSGEKLTSFIPIPDSKDFECHFEIVMEMSLPKDNIIANYDANTRAGSEKMAELANGLAKAIASTDHVQVLRLYEDGWGIPEMRTQAAAEGALQLYLQGGNKGGK